MNVNNEILGYLGGSMTLYNTLSTSGMSTDEQLDFSKIYFKYYLSGVMETYEFNVCVQHFKNRKSITVTHNDKQYQMGIELYMVYIRQNDDTKEHIFGYLNNTHFNDKHIADLILNSHNPGVTLSIIPGYLTVLSFTTQIFS